VWRTCVATLKAPSFCLLNLRRTNSLQGHAMQVWSVAFSPDGQTLASGCSDRTVKLWDVSTAY
jgi:WD40 repeat protein